MLYLHIQMLQGKISYALGGHLSAALLRNDGLQMKA